MLQLERHRGHFYNWYDTQTLRPLLPVYVSSVDSGNLVGHVLTLRAGLAALPDQPILAARWLEGLEDTFRMVAADLMPSPSKICTKVLPWLPICGHGKIDISTNSVTEP